MQAHQFPGPNLVPRPTLIPEPNLLSGPNLILWPDLILVPTTFLHCHFCLIYRSLAHYAATMVL